MESIALIDKDKLLVFAKNGTHDQIKDFLAQNDWHVDCASTETEFSSMLQCYDYAVVITMLTDDSEMLACIEHHALLTFSTKWIALIPHDRWLEQHPDMRFSQIFYDYHHFPLQTDRFLDTLGHAYGMARLARYELNNSSREEILVTDSSDDEIIGTSDQVKLLRHKIKAVAEENLSVLILGESGSGKELVAKNIHAQSKRSQYPFITINCASLPGSVIHSELFGHEKGAFAGADKRVIGKIEAADLGTLLLDEVADMPMNIQVSILRFLETRKIQRLGGVNEIDIDCRIILTTNVDLKAAVNEGNFREDLYHHINVMRLKVPALRERRSDIPILAESFLQHFNKGKPKKYFSNECFRAMQSYDWPGNIRELMNRIRRALVDAPERAVHSSHLGLESVSNANIINLSTARQLAEQKAIQEALDSCGNNHTLAAEKLGISRTSLYRLLGKFER